MAEILQTPSINKIIPPNPKSSFAIEFQYSGAQFRAHRAVIMDADTYSTIYDQRQIGTSPNHYVPKNTLTAGKMYVVQIQVFDSEYESQGNSSPLSEQVMFYCYSTPTFKISNIKEGDVINSASIAPTIKYSQSEGELIKESRIILYDQFKIEVNSSPTYYGTPENSYTFYSLENNKIYYVRAIGETVNGILLETPYIQINVAYSQIPSNTVFSLENVYNGGYINIQSNIKDIQFEANNSTIEDGVLIIEDGSLTYSNGFSIGSNGYVGIGVVSLPIGQFISCKQKSNEIFNISLRKICDSYYFHLNSDGYNIYEPLDNSYIKENKTYKKSGRNVVLYDLVPDGYQLYLEVIKKKLIYDLRINYIEV